MVAYATEAELDLPPLGRAGVVEILSTLPSEITFLNLAALLKRLARIRQDSAGHLQLARDIYGDAPVMEAMGRFCAVDGHVIFSEQGLIALLTQAVVHCRPDSHHEFTPYEWAAFKRVLLGAAGLLEHETELGEYEEDQPEEWLVYMTQNLLFNATTNFGNGLGRTWRLFGELAADSSRWKTPLDFAGVVAETGLSITQQLALAFGLYSIVGMDNDVIAITEEGWRDTCKRVAPDRSPDEVIAQIATSPAQMRAELTSEEAKRIDPNLRWASVPFIERPFLRLDNGHLMLVSPRAIEGWPVEGIYYRLLRAAKKLDPRKGVQHFTAFAGELTEAATIELVEDAHERASERHLNVGRVLRAQPLKGGGESTDIFVLANGDVVVIEISSSRITASTRLTGDLGALRRDLEKVLVKRVKQLDRTVSAILNDEFADLPAHAVKRIFPVIASVEPMRWTPMLHAYLRRELPGLLQQGGVQPLQFAELEDLEILMSLLGPASLAQLLSQKIQQAGVDPDIQLWLRDSPFAPLPTRPAIVTERMDRLFYEIYTQLGFDKENYQRWKDEQEQPAG